MSWGLVFRIRQTLKGSLWVVPLIGGLLGVALSYASVHLENHRFVPAGWDYSTSTALTVLTTVVGATVGLLGFVVTVSVLVVQMVTGTFSPRYMRIWYRDPVLKATLAMLLLTLTFSYTLLRQVDEAAPNLGVSLVGFCLASGLVLFLVFLDRVVHRLRPVKVAEIVARAGREAFQSTVELTTTRRRSAASAEIEKLLVREPRVVTARSGSLHDRRRGPLRWATEHDA